MDPKLLEALAGLLSQKSEGETQAPQFVTVDAFNAAMTEIGNKLESAINSLPEMVAKALPTQRQGEGSRNQMGGDNELTLDNDPAHFVVAKAQRGEDITDPAEQAVALAMFKAFYAPGLSGNE